MTSETLRPLPKLAGVSNFRTLCGLRASDGRTIRPLMLMRSDRLCDLTEADWQHLRVLKNVTVCDLRTIGERTQHPNRIPADCGVTELYFDIPNDLRGDAELMAQLVANPTQEGSRRMMQELYRRLPRNMAATLRTVADLLVTRGTPVLIHCAAGKDRTGFAIAMLLHALGVPRDDIYEDYLTSRHWAHPVHHDVMSKRLAAHAIPAEAMPEVIPPILGVHESYLDAAFSAATDEFGSLDAYLEAAVALDSARMRQLRDRLLV
jgi:protein-tyrosine phosphatase